MEFSDTTNKDGIIELIEDLTGTQSSSSSSYTLAKKTRDVNNAFAKYMMLAISSAGRWQVDDTNQADYPIIYTNVTSGQNDYSFTNDGSTPANQILDITRVEIKDTSGNWRQLQPVDQDDLNGVALDEFMETDGEPQYYDKRANGIFLYPATNYTQTDSLKIYYNRMPVYFLTTDTTKKPGIPDMFHEYLAIRPAYTYAHSKGLSNKVDLRNEMLSMEEDIKEYYRDRNKDEKLRLRTAYRNPR
jgi:hypothetical protein